MSQNNTPSRPPSHPGSEEVEEHLERDSDDKKPVNTGEDPTKAVLSESGLNGKHLCDYVVNVATGCRHGCKFCYVPSTPAIRTRPDMLKEKADVDNPQSEWGQYVLYRDDIVERIDGILDRKQKWRTTEFGQGVVGISFATDAYMDGRAGEITRKTVESLANHGRYSRVLTRNPILALQDMDVFKDAGEYVTIGSSIPCFDAEHVSAIEPRAPAPEHRLRGLKKFSELGVQTFVSLSPTYPTQSRQDIKGALNKISECDPSVIFHEPINPRSGNFSLTVDAAKDEGAIELARELEKIRDREKWLEYSLKQFIWVQEIGEELDLPVHLWPDKKHLKYTEGEVFEWLNSWKERQSPERFAEREPPSEKPPSTPDLNLS